jgi:hypothetical protein
MIGRRRRNPVPPFPALPGPRVLPGGGLLGRLLPVWLAALGLLASFAVASAGHPAGGPAGCPSWLPACGQPWETYAVFDTVFMQRDNFANPTDLVIDGDTLAPVIGSRDLQFPVAPGVRALFGRHGPGGVGWEFGYLGVYGMFASNLAAGPGTLEVPPSLSSFVPSLRNASLARTTYGSTLNSAETNLLLTDTWVHRPRLSAYEIERHAASLTVDWIAGFRWAGLDESASIVLAEPADAVVGTYDVRSSSNLFGAQIGTRGRLDWQRWALEGWLKAALAGAALSQSQAPIVDSITGFVERDARGSTTGTVGGIFDIGGALVYRLDETWGLRFGYSMMWLTGVALAPDQFDFSADPQAGTAVDGNATLWLGGGTLGLEARW